MTRTGIAGSRIDGAAAWYCDKRVDIVLKAVPQCPPRDAKVPDHPVNARRLLKTETSNQGARQLMSQILKEHCRRELGQTTRLGDDDVRKYWIGDDREKRQCDPLRGGPCGTSAS